MAQELDEIRKALFSWLIIFAVFAVFLFFTPVHFPQISTNSIALSLFEKIYSDLVPQNIKLLVTNPLNVFFIQIQVSLFFAFLLSLPILFYRVISYLSPALHKHEKQVITKAFIPAVLLFLTGCLFAYHFLVPLTLQFMNSYNTTLNATIYFEINEFISFALLAILISGIAFMLPIFMRTLSILGIVNARSWLEKFKYSLIAIVIFTAIITPDGTGVTMVMLSLPLISLYLLGCLLSREVIFSGN